MGQGESTQQENEGDEVRLDREILNDLSPFVREHVIEQYEKLKSQLQDARNKSETIRVDSEQKYFEIENGLVNSQKELQDEKSRTENLLKVVNDLETKYGEAVSKLRDVELRYAEKEKVVGDFERRSQSIEKERTELVEMLDKKNKDLEAINSEWSSMSERLTEAMAAKVSAMTKLEEVKTKELNLQHREKRIEQGKAHIDKQIQWLENELKQKTDEVLTARQDQARKSLDLQSQLSEKTDECNRLEEVVKALRESNEEYARKIETYIQKMREGNEMNSELEEQYRNENIAQERLITLYKGTAEESENKVSELLSSVEELQGLLKQAADVQTELEKKRHEEHNQFSEKMLEMDDRVNSLEKELENANALIEASRKQGLASLTEKDMETISPAAAAASRLLKSGMTLTQIYSEYVTVSENLYSLKEENQRLNDYLETVLKEIEEKSPILKKQREDYEKAVETVNRMTSQLEEAMVKCEALQVKADDSQRKYGSVARENQRLKQRSVDLSQQVRMLIKELEEARGTVVHMEDLDGSSQEVSSSSSAVITEKLVTFRSIGELQEQNQRLLEVVRELSDKKEEEERLSRDTKIVELTTKLEEAKQDIEKMTESRERQATMVESIIRQRDMYKTLMQQAGTSPPSMTSPFTHTTSTPMPSAGLSTTGGLIRSPGGFANHQLDEEKNEHMNTKRKLESLEQDFNTYRKEKLTHEKMIEAENEKFRKDASDFRLKSAQLGAQLDHANEKFKILQGNISGYKKEIEGLQEKKHKLMASVEGHEKQVILLTQELMTTKEKLVHAEVSCNHLKAERDQLKNVEHRLNAELEFLSREKVQNETIIANIEKIQSNLQHNDNLDRAKLNNKIDILERENSHLQRKLEAVDSSQRGAVSTLERQLIDAQGERDFERKEHKDTQDDLTKLNVAHQALAADLKETTQKLLVAEARISDLSKAGEVGHSVEEKEEEIKDLKIQLEQTTNRSKALEDQLTRIRQHADEYQSIADSCEANLKEQNEVSKQIQDTSENQLKEAKEISERLEKRNALLEEEQRTLMKENIKITENSHALNAELKKKTAELEQELNQVTKDRDNLKERLEATLVNLSEEKVLTEEYQSRYEKEVMDRATDVKSLSDVRSQLIVSEGKISEAENTAKNMKESYDIARKSWNEQEAVYKSEESTLKERLADLQEQNKIMHEQLEKLTQKMSSVHKTQEQQEKEASELAESVKRDESKTHDELLQVVRFLHKHKDIAEAELEVVKLEGQRLRKKIETMQEQLSAVKSDLEEERTKTEAGIQTAAQHADLMRKVSNVNLLNESNLHLREEKEKLAKELQIVTDKLKPIEEESIRLRNENAKVISQCDVLTSDKSELKSEIERWKSRTNHLIEQCNKVDPGDLKRLTEEKETMANKYTKMEEENKKTKTDLQKISNDFASEKVTTANLQKEKDELEKKVEQLKKDQLTRDKTIGSLRNLGRKLRSDLKESQKKLEEQSQDKSLEEKITTMETKASKDAEVHMQQIKEYENKLKLTEEKTKEVSTMSDKLTAQLSSVEAEKVKLQDEAKTKDDEIKSLKGKISTVEKELESAKSKTSSQGEYAELEKKNAYMKQLIDTSMKKIRESKDQNAQLTTEKRELQTKIDEMEKKLDEKEKEKKLVESQLAAARTSSESSEEIKKLQEDNSMLEKKVQWFQRQLEQASTKPTERLSQEPPKTANIRPMAPAANQVRPMQTSQGRSLSTENRATASIRPYQSPSGTPPTATVMPTTQQAPDSQSLPIGAATPIAITISTPIQARPTQQVQPLSSEEPIVEVSALAADPRMSSPSPVFGQVEAMPSPASRDTTPLPGTSMQGAMKRPRESDSEDKETKAVDLKRLKTQDEDESPAVALVEPITASSTIPAPTATVLPQVHMEPSDTDNTVAEEDVAIIEEEEDASVVDADNGSEPAEDYQQGSSQIHETNQDVEEEDIEPYEEDDEIAATGNDNAGMSINLSDDDDNDETVDQQQELDAEEVDVEEDEEDEFKEEGEDQQAEDEDAIQVLEDDEEDIDGAEEEEEEEQQNEDDDDVVVVLDESDEEETTPVTKPSTIVPPASLPIPSTSGMGAHHAIRTFPGNVRNQFMSHVGDEDVGDGEVPSTPTLFQPKKHEGFAEAVSSPRVPNRQFSFSQQQQQQTQPAFAQLEAQEVLGMDDTRVDLTTFGDGSGRSVPSTPISHTPPLLTVTPETEEETSQEVLVEEGANEGSAVTTVVPDVAEATEEECDEQSLKPIQSQQEGVEEFPEEVVDTSGDSTAVSAVATSTIETSDTAVQQTSAAETQATKPRIQRIVWDSPGESSIPTQITQGQPQLRRFRGRGNVARRGTPRGAVQQRTQPQQQQAPRYTGAPPLRAQTAIRSRGRGRGRPF